MDLILDRDNLESAAGFRLEGMLNFIGQKKQVGEEGILYPWYIPYNTMKLLQGYKKYIFEGLKKEDIFVTDFLAGVPRPEMNGYIRDIYICWTPEAKAKAEAEGLVFV